MARQRGFVLGPAVVDPFDVAFGKESDTFQPEAYGDYIATSNGVYACATLRAELLSSLPLKLYRSRNGNRVEVERGPAVDLLTKVNPFWTFNRLISMTELSLCLWGEAFWFLERGEMGRQLPREIWWGRPDKVRVVPDPGEYIKGFLYRPSGLGSGNDIPFTPQEVIWLRYPNPLDEYEGLSPLAAARLAADVASAAMKSNRNIFGQGLQAGGFVMPKEGTVLSEEQAKELEILLDRRFKGVDKAHRWGVFRFEAQMTPAGWSPKEAEFLGALNFSLEEICRAYRVPLDLVGGQRTYDNVSAAMLAVWEHAILPEGRFIATELVEQLLPMFPGQADEVAFDSSNVAVLQEDKNAQWAMAQGQIEAGAITINEWRDGQGLEPVSWGDTWWAPVAKLPAGSTAERAILTTDGRTLTMPILPAARRAVEYGSTEHEQLWRRFVRRTDRQEREFARFVRGLFRRQRDSVLDRLRDSERSQKRGIEDVVLEPFNLAQWIRTFREEVRPVLNGVVREAGEDALSDLLLEMAFDVTEPQVARFLEQRAQRFAREVNETTWQALRDSLSEGVNAGESIKELEKRVEEIMGDRIRSSSETIARTEVIGASNGGTLEAWRQSGVVSGKTWLAALDQRTRETHVNAHGQERNLNEDFDVGAGRGPAPGQIGLPEEDINCRCAMTAVLQ